MTVETIQQPMSDFAIKLANALKSIGHHYFGKVDYENINIQEYLKLSPREMALRYAREHDLDTKKKLFDILKLIYTENKKDNFNVSLREQLEDKKLDYILYSTAITRFGLVERKGERAQTKYRWLGGAAPVFSDAEALWEFTEQIKSYELDQKSVDYIQNHLKDGLESVLKALNPEDSNLKHYQITRVFKVKQSANNVREKKLKDLLEARKVMDREISRKAPEPSVSLEPVAPEPSPVITKDPEPQPDPVQVEEKKKAVTSLEEDTPDEGLLFLMAQRVKMYKKIVKIQEKMLRKYEQKLKK